MPRKSSPVATLRNGCAPIWERIQKKLDALRGMEIKAAIEQLGDLVETLQAERNASVDLISAMNKK